MEGYWKRHERAVFLPSGPEKGIVNLLRGWLSYADQHKASHESSIGEDGFLGDYWASIGASIRGLLNGEIGRLDGGALDSLICNILEAEGFNPDDL